MRKPLLATVVALGLCSTAQAETVNGNPGGAPSIWTWALAFADNVKPTTTEQCVSGATKTLKIFEAQNMQTDDTTATGVLIAGAKQAGNAVSVLCLPSNRVIFITVAGEQADGANQIGETFIKKLKVK